MSAYIAITGSGLVTCLGNDSASSCAAMRCSIDNIQHLAVTDQAGKAIRGCMTESAPSCQGEEHMILLTANVLQQCLDTDPTIVCADTPLVLCLPERSRAGRPIVDDDNFLAAVQTQLGWTFSRHSRLLTGGHVVAAQALRLARQLLDENQSSIRHVLIASADSLLSAQSLSEFEKHHRLLTSYHSDGFIPGEAGAALVIERSSDKPRAMHCLGLGFSMEPAPVLSNRPSRAEGLTLAIRSALEDAQIPMQDMAYRVSDLAGEHYYFREAAIALSRTLRVQRNDFDLLHPAEYVGNTGASLGLVMLAFQHEMFLVQAPCPPQVLMHLADDDGKRAAMVLGSS